MPSDKKRVNLTIPDSIYERLQAYKEETGLFNDATVCLQLIVQQLNSLDTAKRVAQFMQKATVEQLSQISGEGFAIMKEVADKAQAGLPYPKSDT